MGVCSEYELVFWSTSSRRRGKGRGRNKLTELTVSSPSFFLSSRRLDLLVQPFVEKASYDDNLPEPSLVLENLLKTMPGLSRLSIQAPLPLTLLETLLLPESQEFNRIERLVDLALVIQVSWPSSFLKLFWPSDP